MSRIDNVSRRDLLKLGAVGATVMSLKGTVHAARKAIPVGVQLYSIRQVIQKDIPGHLAALKAMGYDGVEFAGYYGKSAEELRKMLDDAGLRCCGTHTGMDTLKGDNLEKTIAYNKTLGNKYLIVPWLKLPDQAACIAAAGELTELAAKLKPEGMLTGYHCHQHDFKALDGSTPWEILFKHASPDVAMQIDTGNCMSGGGDPVAMLKEFPGRAHTIHLKEYGGGVVGEGKVKWNEVLDICETTGRTEWYIIEEEGGGDKAMDTVKRARANLAKLMA